MYVYLHEETNFVVKRTMIIYLNALSICKVYTGKELMK